MKFDASKKEWCELYSFFRILSDGQVCLGTVDGKPDSERVWKVAFIQREEHNGIRQYHVEDSDIRICGDSMSEPCVVSRGEFGDMADLILRAVKESPSDDVTSPEEVVEFMKRIDVFDLEAQTQDRTDFSIAFWHSASPLTGFVVRSRLSQMNRLLDGGRAANLKFEQTGVKFAVPTVNKVNAIPESQTEVAERMMMIERLGGILKYSDVADRVFRCNLSMIDLHFPRMLAEMIRIMHLDDITRVSDLVERIKEINPLKIKEELISKHHYYEYKMKQFLLALALGMRPAKIFNGQDSAVGGMLLVTGSGDVLCYHKWEKEIFSDFLYRNSRLEKGALEKDKYGFLERENGVYYFKLNAKIGLTKR